MVEPTPLTWSMSKILGFYELSRSFKYLPALSTNIPIIVPSNSYYTTIISTIIPTLIPFNDFSDIRKEIGQTKPISEGRLLPSNPRSPYTQQFFQPWLYTTGGLALTYQTWRTWASHLEIQSTSLFNSLAQKWLAIQSHHTILQALSFDLIYKPH